MEAVWIFDDPAGLKFVPEPLLSLDSDNLCRELEPKVAYIFSGVWNSPTL
jgi:hypothetical protein